MSSKLGSNKIDLLEKEFVSFCDNHCYSIDSISSLRSGLNSYIPQLDTCIFFNTSNINSPHLLKQWWNKLMTSSDIYEHFIKIASSKPDYLSIVLFFSHEIIRHRAPFITSSISLPISFLNYLLNEEFTKIANDPSSLKKRDILVLNQLSNTLSRILTSLKMTLEGYALFYDLLILIKITNQILRDKKEAIKRGYNLINHFINNLDSNKSKRIYLNGFKYYHNIFQNWGLSGIQGVGTYLLNPYLSNLISFSYNPFDTLRQISSLSDVKKPVRRFNNSFEVESFIRKYINLQGWINYKTNPLLDFLLNIFPYFRSYRWKKYHSLHYIKQNKILFMPPQIFLINAKSSDSNWVINNIPSYSLFADNFFKTILREQLLISFIERSSLKEIYCPYKAILNSCKHCFSFTRGYGTKYMNKYSHLMRTNICDNT